MRESRALPLPGFATASSVFRRSLLVSLLRFAVVFGVLAAPWPGLAQAFVERTGDAVTAAGGALFENSTTMFLCRAPHPEEGLPEWRGVVSVRVERPSGSLARAGAVDLRRAGYLQLAAFLALAAAWPLRTLRQWLCGGLAAGVIVATAVAIPILAFLEPLGAIHLARPFALGLALVSRALVGAPGMAFAVPGLVWLLVRMDATLWRIGRPAK